MEEETTQTNEHNINLSELVDSARILNREYSINEFNDLINTYNDMIAMFILKRKKINSAIHGSACQGVLLSMKTLGLITPEEEKEKFRNVLELVKIMTKVQIMEAEEE